MIENCDVFFISYDEPNRDSHWESVISKIPGAQRVHGVQGFDAAYKACALQSKTPRFFTIDGDNEIHSSFLDLKLDFSQYENDWVLSWPAINSINGLRYGNGGVKNWSKETVLQMKTHEKSEEISVDFFHHLKYFLIPETLSRSCIHYEPYHAFRSGFREAIKMCFSIHGELPVLDGTDKPSVAFKKHLFPTNYERLKIWCSIGSDIPNGLWSMYGARLGCKMLISGSWDCNLIRDYEWFQSFWDKTIWPRYAQDEAALHASLMELEDELNQVLDLGVHIFTKEASSFFKSNYKNPVHGGLRFK